VAAPDPVSILTRNRAEATKLAQVVGPASLKKTLEQAQLELNHRLTATVGLTGPGADSFTATQLKLTLQQIEHTLKGLTSGMQSTLVNQAAGVADLATDGTIQFMQDSEKKYRGINARLPLNEAMMFDRSHQGARASMLRHLTTGTPGVPATKAKQGILARYGMTVLDHFEDRLKLGMIQGQPWAEVRNDLTAASPFLKAAPAHWAERIVRTETMGAYNRAGWEATRAANDALGDMVKILSATFDDRTGWDSYQVHGQIRKPMQAFEWAGGYYQHPPNRPNDREVVVPHRISWPIPASLKWRDDGEVQARWTAQGNKGSPPSRPTMTTVDIDLFGKAAPPKPLSESVPEPVPMPEPVHVPEPVAMPTPHAQKPQHMTDEELDALEEEHPLEAEPDQPGMSEATLALMNQPTLLPEHQHENILGTFDPTTKKWSNQVGEKKGSNPGGMFTGADGVKRYVKFYANPEQAILEDLTNRIYKDLNIAASSSELFKLPDDKLAYSSTIIDGKKLSHALDEHVATKMLDGFAADVLVANWDAVGTGLDNVMVTHGGTPVRIDSGGSLLYRAQGGLKPPHLLNEVTEWENFFAPSKNEYYSGVAKKAGVTSAEQITGLYEQVNTIKALHQKYGSWKAYLDKHAPTLDPASAAKVASMLEARTKFLLEKQSKMKGANLDDHAQLAKAEEVAVTKAAQAAVIASPLPANASAEAKALALKAAKAKASRDYRARKKGLPPPPPVEPPAAPRTFYNVDTLKTGHLESSLERPTGIATYEEQRAFQRSAHDKMESLKAAEAVAFGKLLNYTGNHYGPIRDAVRLTQTEWETKYPSHGGGFGGGRSGYTYKSAKSAHAKIESTFDRVDKATAAGEKTALTNNEHESKVTSLYRGIGQLSRDALHSLLNKGEFHTEAITSTSWNPRVALSFARSGGAVNHLGKPLLKANGEREEGYAIVFHINVTPKTAASRMAVETHSKTGKGEGEFVVRAGTKYRIRNAEKITNDRRDRLVLVTLDEIAD